LILTGSLGEVMKESAQIALSYLRALAHRYEIDENLYENHRIHIHIPSGAIPKDGPSAGLALFLTLLSLASNKPADHKIAVTGEISLSGRVLPVGGIKEKVLAARRSGIKRVILPEDNLKNLQDLPLAARDEMIFFGIKTIDEAIPLVIASLKPVRKTDCGQTDHIKPAGNFLPPASVN
ncbi:MAG TPA: endopeptidase La, partial [Desulfarculaceae bacterium]|nr:endopeptidase La [Desulfarculaceae bacterium]